MVLTRISDIREIERLGLSAIGIASFSEESVSDPRKGVKLETLALQCLKGKREGETVTHYMVDAAIKNFQPWPSMPVIPIVSYAFAFYASPKHS